LVANNTENICVCYAQYQPGNLESLLCLRGGRA